MNRVHVVVGVVLLALGLLSLKYDSYSWTKETTVTVPTPVVELTLPARQRRTIQIPATASWGAAVVGLLLVFVGLRAPGKPAGGGSAKQAPGS